MQVLTIVYALVAAISAIDLDQLKPNLIVIPAHKEKIKATRIVNGEEVEPHSIPYQAIIIPYDSNNGTLSFCGASIIDKQWLLTAAHCILKDAVKFDAILGAHSLSKIELTLKLVTSTEFIIHEDFDNDTLQNDIALLKLSEPIEFTDSIQPISLNTEDNVDGKEATIAGWGDQSKDNNNGSDVLHSITVPVISNSECQSSYEEIHDSVLCTSTRGDSDGVVKSMCLGDSGGPLVVDGKTQIGISSGVMEDCESGLPNIFTRVSYYTDWLNEKMA